MGEETNKEKSQKYVVIHDDFGRLVGGHYHTQKDFKEMRKNTPEFDKKTEQLTFKGFKKASDACTYANDCSATWDSVVKFSEKNPLTEKQKDFVMKYGDQQLSKEISTNVLACQDFIKKTAEEWEKKKEAQLSRPLNEYEQKFFDKYSTQEEQQKLAQGNFKECREIVNKKQEEMLNAPLSEKQKYYVEKNGGEELKKALEEGKFKECRNFISEHSKSAEKQLAEKPLTEKQLMVINIHADEKTRELIKTGDNVSGHKFLNDLYKEVNKHVLEYEKQSGKKLTPEDFSNLQRTELIVKKNEYSEIRKDLYDNVMQGMSPKSVDKLAKDIIETERSMKNEFSKQDRTQEPQQSIAKPVAKQR